MTTTHKHPKITRLMSYDLASTPTTGIRVQACGDCHLLNFGLFATPERNLIFDINDFDETLPAPWEWDVKRLGASFAVATRDNGHSDEDARDIAIECVRAYRERLRDYSKRMYALTIEAVCRNVRFHLGSRPCQVRGCGDHQRLSRQGGGV